MKLHTFTAAIALGLGLGAPHAMAQAHYWVGETADALMVVDRNSIRWKGDIASIQFRSLMRRPIF